MADFDPTINKYVADKSRNTSAVVCYYYCCCTQLKVGKSGFRESLLSGEQFIFNWHYVLICDAELHYIRMYIHWHTKIYLRVYEWKMCNYVHTYLCICACLYNIVFSICTSLRVLTQDFCSYMLPHLGEEYIFFEVKYTCNVFKESLIKLSLKNFCDFAVRFWFI